MLTNFAALTPQQKLVWSRDVWSAARDQMFVKRFLGTGQNAMIQRITELTKTEKGEKALKCTICGAVLKTEEIPVVTANWMRNQSACSLGVRFRDLENKLTNKWYMFTPVKLTEYQRKLLKDLDESLKKGGSKHSPSGESWTDRLKSFFS